MIFTSGRVMNPTAPQKSSGIPFTGFVAGGLLKTGSYAGAPLSPEFGPPDLPRFASTRTQGRRVSGFRIEYS
jgi:hypothetical protein